MAKTEKSKDNKGKKMELPNEASQAGSVTKTQNVLVSYISDLIFTFSVLAIFLGVTVVFHIYFKPTSLFVILPELLVLSFGTLWCVLFFIKITDDFIKKLHLGRQEAIGQTNSRLLHSGHVNIGSRFLGVVLNQWKIYSLWSIIIFILLYASISFAEIVQENAEDISILACELICETGPDFSKSVKTNQIPDMLTSYSKFQEQKHLAGFLELLTPYNAKNALSKAMNILENTQGSQKEVAYDIWQAGEEIQYSRLKTPKLIPSNVRLHKYRKIPTEMLTEIENALKESEALSVLFEKEKSLDNAVRSCEANRKTMFLVCLARNNRDIQFISDFRSIAEKCEKNKNIVANMLPDNDPRKEFLKMIARSEHRRVEILKDMENRNTEKAIDKMWEASDKSYSRREHLLKLCDIVLKEKYSEVIVS